MGKKDKMSKYPFVSICTPTFNRRPFIPIIIKCFENQNYPKDKMEWIIVDDGTDKLEDLVSHIPQVKYFKYEEKMSLGKKRNITNEKAKGDIIIYMDDDDYYPPDRVSHAILMLRTNPKALCAGSSTMFMYFKHLNKMYQFGPYGASHATAATFAFRRELLNETKFDENATVAEERIFLKDYKIPFVQLDPIKSILVFSHNHNSFDKKELLKQLPNPYVHETTILPADIVKEADVYQFFMKDIDKLLDNYKAGSPENKPDVAKQITEIKETREKMIQEQTKQQQDYQDFMNKLTNTNPQMAQNKIDQLTYIVQELSNENNQLKAKVNYLEEKIKQLIMEQIQIKRNSVAEQKN
jgi:glycosyltransferase involved in cell wall biosynthesis